MPKISIIVPVYNVEPYLKRSIDSLVNQTLKDIEIILINDCSTDNSLAILQDYALKDKRIKLINLDINQGASVAKNKGLEQAKLSNPEYLGFIDPDDDIDLNYYETLYNKSKEQNYDIVKCCRKEISLDKKVVISSLNQQIKDKGKFHFYHEWTTAIYKSSIVFDNNIFFQPELKKAEDTVFLHQVLLKAKSIAVIDDVYYYYYRRENSLDSKKTSIDNIKSALKAREIIANDLNNAYKVDISPTDYIQTYAFLLTGIMGYIVWQNDSKEAKELCGQELITLYNNCVTPKELENLFSGSYSVILQYVTENNVQKLTELFMKYDNLQSLILSQFRNRVQKDMAMKKISIIIPIYNCENYIGKCLESLINQTFKDIEIICVNDCSTDGTMDVLKAYAEKDKRIKILHNDVNSGAAISRNNGIDVATGEYVYFIDSDDWIDNDYLEKMVRAIENAGTDIVLNLNIETNGGKYIHPTMQSVDPKGEYIDRKTALEKAPWHIWARLYHKSFIDVHHIRYLDIKKCNDIPFHLITHNCSRDVFVFMGSTYHYNSRNDSITGSGKQADDRDYWTIMAYDKTYDYLAQKNLVDRSIKMFSVFPYFKVDTDQKFNLYKSFFGKVQSILDEKTYNELELYFAKSILKCSTLEEYKSKYNPNVTMGFIRRKK